MDSCARWHKANCSKPNISVHDGVPRCHSCDANSSLLVTRLVAQSHDKGGNIQLPEEKPLGEANLWWPPCVPYRRFRVGIRKDPNPIGDEEEEITLSLKNYELSSASPIYPSSLDSSRFRLFYVTESDDVASPIHIQLQDYALNDCPEYETVSYVWGGEEGDSTPCKPVYVGSFWDVILATKNCSALLHYLRPRRGCRFVWMDAICINQADNAEKPAQISRMCDIYTNCERVVAYFGEDLVLQDPTRIFRRRIDFQKSAFLNGEISGEANLSSNFLMSCAKTAGLRQDQLFRRRYLTRIWIVQELLLSKNVILPLGDSDILCHGRETIHLFLRPDRGRVRVSGVDGKSLSDLLRATAHCQATDPRDKIFGLLGLFEPRDISRRLVPDYSLSWRDCWVGTAAYMLLVEGDFALLAHAVGINRLNLPTWVPDIQKAGSWFSGSTSRAHKSSQTYKEASRNPASSISPNSINNNPRGVTVQGAFTEDSASSRDKPKVTTSVKWATEFVMYSMNSKKLRVIDQPATTWWRQASHRLVLSESLCTPSGDSTWINSSDGSLHLQALRVFNGPCQMTVEAEPDGFASIWVRGSSTAARFRVTGFKQRPSTDEKLQLFVVPCQGVAFSTNSNECEPRASTPFLLALTNIISERYGRLVKLRDCCIIYDINIYSNHHLARINGLKDVTNTLHSLHWILHNLHAVDLSSYGVDSGHDWIFPCVFPSLESRTRDIIPLMICLTEPRSAKGVPVPLARSLYASAKKICPDFDPLLCDDNFYLTIKDEASLDMLFSIWEPRRCHLPRTPVVQSYWDTGSRDWSMYDGLIVDYEIPADPEIEAMDEMGCSDDECEPGVRIVLSFSEHHEQWKQFWNVRQFPLRVRFPVRLLVSRMKKTTPYAAMCYAREYSTRRGEQLESFLDRSPMSGDRYIFAEGWGQRLVEELGVAWEFESITIV